MGKNQRTPRRDLYHCHNSPDFKLNLYMMHQWDDQYDIADEFCNFESSKLFICSWRKSRLQEVKNICVTILWMASGALTFVLGLLLLSQPLSPCFLRIEFPLKFGYTPNHPASTRRRRKSLPENCKTLINLAQPVYRILLTCFSNISEGQFVTWAIRSARKNLARLGVNRFNRLDVCDADMTLCKLLTPEAPSTERKPEVVQEPSKDHLVESLTSSMITCRVV